MSSNILKIILITNLIVVSMAGHLHGRGVHVHRGHTIHGGEMGRYRSVHQGHGHVRPIHYGGDGGIGNRGYGRGEHLGSGGFHMRSPFSDEIGGGGHLHGPRFRSASEPHIHTRTHAGHMMMGR